MSASGGWPVAAVVVASAPAAEFVLPSELVFVAPDGLAVLLASALELVFVPPDAPDPLGSVVEVTVVDDGDVADFGSTMLSIDSAVPEWQFTRPPPTACQALPVTWMSRAG